jgi:SAM-dependent methyltransferase
MMILDLARKALSSPLVFDTYQSLVGAPECHRRFICDMVMPVAGERVIDIGCGVGASLRYLPETVDYVGVDISKSYIAKAKGNFGQRGWFVCADVTTFDAATLCTFDRAFSFGVLHHLSDELVGKMVNFVRRVLKPGGVFVSIDPCYEPEQHFLAKLLIDNDRGQHVRDRNGFVRVLEPLGPVRAEIRHDLLRIPYTQIVMWVKVNASEQVH